MEAATGFEPVMEVLQTSALPLGYAACADYSTTSLRQTCGDSIYSGEKGMERETRLELATSTLARWRSTN